MGNKWVDQIRSDNNLQATTCRFLEVCCQSWSPRSDATASAG